MDYYGYQLPEVPCVVMIVVSMGLLCSDSSVDMASVAIAVIPHFLRIDVWLTGSAEFCNRFDVSL